MRKEKFLPGSTFRIRSSRSGCFIQFFFAAWKSVNSEWVYTDNNGNNVTSAWRSDNGESYYLGSDGYMVRNTLLEDNGNYYYLRNGGQMLKNGWRFL